MAIISSNLNFPTNKQVPDQAIMQIYGKAAYLGNQYVLPIAAFSVSGTSELNVALLKCPAASTASMFINVRRASSTAQIAQIKFYVQPTATAGTPVTPVNLRALNTNASQSSCSSSPTSSANGTLISTIECPATNETILDDSSLIILDPGSSLLVTCIPGGTSKVSLNLVWFEL